LEKHELHITTREEFHRTSAPVLYLSDFDTYCPKYMANEATRINTCVNYDRRCLGNIQERERCKAYV